LLVSHPHAIGQEEEDSANGRGDRIQEASDFVIGLSALNNQIISALDEQPTRRVIVLPFPHMDGRYTIVSSFIREQMVTSLAATRKFHIIHDSSLVDVADQAGIPPMELGNSDAFKQVASQYENDSIVAGTIVDLNRKLAVMARIIQGSNGRYGGGAIVYIRIDDEIASLMTIDRQERGFKPQLIEPEEIVRTADDAGAEATEAAETATETSEPAGDMTAAEVDTTEEPVMIPKPEVGGQGDLAIYRMGHEQFKKERFSEAIGYFEEVVRQYPESALADNAIYWIGEAYYSMKRWEDSRASFQRVLDQYPYGNKVPAATLKRGYAEEKLGRLNDAIASMEEVIKRFEDTDEAELAKRKLQLLRAAME
jgi:tol-pal system protein YbgF